MQNREIIACPFLIVNEQAKRLAEKLDGFWLLVTNYTERVNHRYTVTPEEAIAKRSWLNRLSAILNRSWKSNLSTFGPKLTWKHSILSHLINRTLTRRLHEQKGSLSKDC